MSAAVLVAVRVFAILRAQVLWRSAIGPWWWIIAAGLALLVAPWSAASGPATLDPVAVVAELVLGTMLGLVASLPGWALLGAAAAMGPLAREAGPSLGGLLVTLVLALAMASGLHHGLLQATLDTVHTWPVGDPRAWIAGADPALLARAAHGMLVLSLSLATPVLLVAAVAEVALRLVGRGPAGTEAPALASAAFVRAGAALVALGASWQAYGAVWAHAAVRGG